MVFKGQDAWRSHPMIAGQWRRPFPHLGLAIGIFTVGLAASKVLSYFTTPVSVPSRVPRWEFLLDENLGIAGSRKYHKLVAAEEGGVKRVRHGEEEEATD